MNMNRTLILSTIFALAAPGFSVFAQAPIDDTKHIQHQLFSPSELQWKEGPPSLPAGAKFALLEGDPSKEGFFVMRLRFPDGYHIPPHTHPKTERVTVVSGTLRIAMGEQLERSKAYTLPAGAFGFWPAGMKHAAWAEGETIVQLHGIGPWAINYVNPADDPRKAKK